MNIKCFLVEYVDGEWMRPDTGEVFTGLNQYHLPVGAIYRRDEMEQFPEYCGTDGKSYTVITPGGEWMIDSRASNCTRKDDKTHKCWCRHGEAPNFTVDKIGNTCNAGAGSILIGGYHGFLRNGFLVPA